MAPTRTHEFVECQEGRHRPLILSEVSVRNQANLNCWLIFVHSSRVRTATVGLGHASLSTHGTNGLLQTLSSR